MILKPPLFAKPIHGHPLGPDGGLAGCWPMNEGAYNKDFNKVFDLSGNGNTGAVQVNAIWTSGKFGSAIEVTGNEPGGIIIADSPSINSATGPGQPRTWVYWIKVTTLKTNTLLTDKSNFGGVQLWSEQQVSGGNYSIDGGVAVAGALTTGFVLVPNVWYYVVFTYDGANAYLYIDGVLIDGPNAQTAAAVNANNLQVISHLNPVNVPQAIIDNLTIYNCALSASEIALLYIEPFCMFERDPIELWSAATLGAAPPVGMAGAMTTNTGYWGW